MRLILFAFTILLSHLAVGQVTNKTLQEISAKKTLSAIQELRELISLPNDALYPEDIEKNTDWLTLAFEKRGFATRVLPTDRTPLFFAELANDPQKATLLFYMHFDGQSVDPAKWHQNSPYTAVLKEERKGQWEEIDWKRIDEKIDPEWRIFGRSTSDDKGPIIMFLQAIDAIKENGFTNNFNIKVILDGEEEKGSPHLAKAVKVHKELLKADHLIINDGPMHLSGKPTLVFGCRGITRVDLTVYGPVKHQHSGHYGNYAPNPAFRLSRLLSSMKDENGRVLIEGYYDGITLSEKTRDILSKVPDNTEKINANLGIAEPEKVGSNLQESLQYPSLNIRGLSAAWTGAQARTIVPAEATASIDIRLVPESDPTRLQSLIKEHMENQGYLVLDRAPTMEERVSYPKIAQMQSGGATLAFRTEINSETGKWLSRAIQRGWNEEPVKVRIMGGTVPIAPFINELAIPAVIVPVVNPDNNQHSPNENLRIGHLTGGIHTFMTLLLL